MTPDNLLRIDVAPIADTSWSVEKGPDGCIPLPSRREGLSLSRQMSIAAYLALHEFPLTSYNAIAVHINALNVKHIIEIKRTTLFPPGNRKKAGPISARVCECYRDGQ